MARRLNWHNGSDAIPGGLLRAFLCAHTVAEAVDRRRPEARALAYWLDSDRAGLHLPDGEDFAPDEGRRLPLSVPAWRRVRTAITRAARATPATPEAPAEQWLATLGTRVGLDGPERRLLTLALFYALDERLEHLVDRVSTARGGKAALTCDASLLTLLTADPPSTIEDALAAGGRLLDSGLVRVDRDGQLQVLPQLASVVRRSTQPKADPFGQLLGPAMPAALPPQAFAHFGAQAAVAAAVLRAAVTGCEPGVNILLSGPPGTGKSAWARHLADRMGLEVLEKRASDLLGPYVGQTEANIAAAFAEARESGAFLVFDEADSLLGDRAGAVRSWEVSQVNEMLTWMEQHKLPFACTTNLPDRLDPASLRRFLVKARFGWLTAGQARLAWKRFFDAEAPEELDSLARLTPADFTLVARRLALTGLSSPDAAMEDLARECVARSGAGPIGFRVG